MLSEILELLEKNDEQEAQRIEDDYPTRMAEELTEKTEALWHAVAKKRDGTSTAAARRCRCDRGCMFRRTQQEGEPHAHERVF